MDSFWAGKVTCLKWVDDIYINGALTGVKPSANLNWFSRPSIGEKIWMMVEVDLHAY